MGMDGSNEHTDADTNASLGSGTDSGDAESDSDAPTSGLPRTIFVAIAIAAIGIVTTGVVVNLLDRVGPAGSADLMWITGYGITVFALWYLLIRPIDFSQRY